MKKTVTAIFVAGLVALSLTACDYREVRKTNIELGKECFQAGGAWNYSEWSGYHCEFGVPQK